MTEPLYRRMTVVQRIATVGDEWTALKNDEIQGRAENERRAVEKLRSVLLARDDVPGYVLVGLLDRLIVTEEVMFAHKKRFLELYEEIDNLRQQVQVRNGPNGLPLPPMRFLAVWREGNSYVPGDVVNCAGTSWHCALHTKARPGTNGDWQMMGKSHGKNDRHSHAVSIR